MKVEMKEIGVQLRRLTTISIRKSYIFICNHPFLVGMFLFLLFMYRSFPFLFSILVSTSPVVICTFALLGFLLSLGDPNIPEIEKEESINHEITSLRTEVQRDTTVVERDASFVVERYVGTNSRNEVENLIEEPISKNNIVDQINEVQDSDMNERKNEETVFLENQYSRIEEMDEESIGLLDTKSPMGSIGSVIAERGDSPPRSPWKPFGEGDDDVADSDSGSGSDSDSDRAESSSPDASMADILPMLDELHPLLNEETPLVTRGSDHGSNASSHRSQGYKEVPRDSDDESENHDDVDDEEDRDEKGDESKPGITWTEDDQKNLMDLGTLELERNQRLESLIARRRARKMMVEKNLIDLNFDLPFSVAPISTTRKNPFDLPHDSNEFPGLPPIPGSAPSIMSQRQNPFDLPYDSSEEKPDLTDDNFQEEFSPLPSREMRFRRHESFNVGPSIFAPPKRGKDDFRFRPYFVPEGSSYSSFQRQMSELSDISKVSSVPETDSICSNVDQDEKKVLEEDISQDVEMGSDLVEESSELVGHQSESSEDEDIIELGQQDGREIDHDNFPKGEIDRDNFQEREIDHDEVDIPSLSLSRTLSIIEEVHYSSGSSSSSLSEEHERAFNEKKDEVLSSLELDMGKVNELADANQEPVYDLSPSSINKSSVLLVEMDKTVVSFSDREIDFCTQNIEMETNESGTSGDTVKAEPILDQGLTEKDENLELLEDDIVTSSSLSLDNQDVKASVQSDLIEEHSICEDQIHSSSSNVYSRSVSVEKPMDELHFLDKPVADLLAENHEELSGPSSMQLESIAEDQNEGNALSEDRNLDQVHSQTLNSQNKSSSFPVQESYFPEGDEIKEIDEWIMELENVGDFSIGKLRSSSNEMPLFEARSVDDIRAILLRNEPVPMKNEAEINSGMLKLEAEELQLGNIEADSCQIGAETGNKTVFKPIHEGTIDSGMLELEAASVQDIKTAFRQINDDENKIVFEPIHDDEIGSGMHELEATSVQDMDTAFRQINDEEIESLREKSEADVAEIGEETENKTVFKPIHDDEIDSRMHELEATSVQDIDTAFRQINDEEIESFPEKSEADVAEISEETENKTVFEPIHDNEIDSGMHELEATSIQDIDTAFGQIKDEEIESFPEKSETHVTEIGVETENKSVFDTIHDDEIDSGMHQLEATSIQDIDTAFRQINAEEIVDSLNAEPFPEKDEADISEETKNKFVFEPIPDHETDSGMHELEATSIQDIDAVFKQINDEEIKKSIIVESLDAEPWPEEIEADVAEIGQENENKAVSEPTHSDKIDCGLHELEATSIQNIDTAFRQINDQEIAPLPETEIRTVFESIHDDEIGSAMHELEATSIQDIDAAFKHINAEEIENPLILDTLDAESVPEKIEAEINEEIENKTVFEPSPDDEIGSSMHELEATSVEDINSVFRRIKEEEIEKPVIVLSLPAKIEAEVSAIEASEPPILESKSTEYIDSAVEKHSNIERFVTAVSDYFEPYILEPEDKAEEIYYGKLELDSTSVKEIDETFTQVNELEDSAGLEPIQDEKIDSCMMQLEAQSLEDLDSAFRLMKEEIRNHDIFETLKADTIPKGSEAGAFENEMPVVKARSIEDIGLDFAKVDNPENHQSNIVEAEDQAEEISSTIVELDEKSVQDIDEAISQFKELENPAEDIDSGMKEFEARSLEDLDLAFRKIDEEAIETSVTETNLVPEKGEIGVSEHENPELPVEKYSKLLPENENNTNIIKEEDQTEDINSQMLELDELSNKEIDATSSSIKEDEKPAFLEPIHAETINLEKDLKVRSHEDIDLTLRNNIEDEVEQPVDVATLINDLAPEKSEAEVPEIETKDREEEIRSQMVELDAQSVEDDATFNLIKELETVDLEMKDFESRSIEDINLSLRDIEKEVENPFSVASPVADLATDKSETNVSKIGAEDQVSAFELVHAEEIISEMKELEAQSLDDIESAFRQFTEEKTEKPVVIVPPKAEIISEKGEAEVSESVDTSETCSSLQVESENKPKSFDIDTPNIETKTQGDSNSARSVEEADNLDNQLNSKFEDGSVGTKSKDVLLSEDAEANIKEPIKAQTSGGFSKEAETSLSDGKGKKKSKSRKSKSCSSSSSSSSSDSGDSD